MVFNDLKIGDRFRLIEPNPNDPKVYCKVDKLDFVDTEFPDGDVFRFKKQAARTIPVQRVGPPTEPLPN